MWLVPARLPPLTGQDMPDTFPRLLCMYPQGTRQALGIHGQAEASPVLKEPGTCRGGEFGNRLHQRLITFPGKAWLQMVTKLSLQWVSP